MFYGCDEIVTNKKNKKTYGVIGYAKNATNGHEGESMVIYQDSDKNVYVREQQEFKEKFEGWR